LQRYLESLLHVSSAILYQVAIYFETIVAALF
jgi:hypothetical protein